MNRRPWITITGASIGIALTLAACSSAGNAEATSSADSTSDQEAALLEFVDCMREHGVDLPDPTVDADGNLRLRPPDDAQGGGGPGAIGQNRDAFEACGDLLGDVRQGFTDQDQTELQDTLLAYAACMREQGIDFPDPDFDSLPQPGGGPGNGGGPFGGSVDPDDPVFQAADEVCRPQTFGDNGGPGFFGRPGGGA